MASKTSMTIRASSVPRILKCPASAYTPREEIAIDASDQTATLGTAVHEALAHVVVTGEVPDLPKIAKTHNVDLEDLTQLVGYGEKAWRALRTEFWKPVAEARFAWHLTADIELAGHLDLHSYNAIKTAVRVADWKSGWKNETESYVGQMMAYAYLASRVYTDATRATVALIWLRDRSYDVLHWDRDELNAWAESLAEKVRTGRNSYAPGEHCRYCPRQTDCPALAKMLHAGVTTLALIDAATELTPAVMLLAYQRVQMVERATRRLRDALRRHIRSHGPIEMDGYRLSLAETTQETINPQPAWPVLKTRLKDEELAKCVSVGKKAVMALVRSKHERGEKAKAEMRLMDDLRAADAVTRVEETRLELTKAKEA